MSTPLSQRGQVRTDGRQTIHEVNMSGEPTNKSTPIRVSDAAARRIEALAKRLSIRRVDATRVALAIGIEALEHATDDAIARVMQEQDARRDAA